MSKLINIVQPSCLYLGQKDGLQCVVVSNLIDELNFPTRLVVGPTVREADGLAMSSRNVYLDATQRAVARPLSTRRCASCRTCTAWASATPRRSAARRPRSSRASRS